MPGYGTLGPDEGTGLLPWSWAEERLRHSHDYWLATVTPDGRPHVMPVWGVLLDDRLWFSSSKTSRKARNLVANPYCCVTTDNPAEPVVAEGPVELITELAVLETVLAAENAKYQTNIGMEMLDPTTNSFFALSPEHVFGLVSADFTGSPTRWVFAQDSRERRASPSEHA